MQAAPLGYGVPHRHVYRSDGIDTTATITDILLYHSLSSAPTSSTISAVLATNTDVLSMTADVTTRTSGREDEDGAEPTL